MDSINLVLGQNIRLGKTGQEAPIMEVRLDEAGVHFEPHPTTSTVSKSFREWSFVHTIHARSDSGGVPVKMYHDNKVLPVLRILKVDLLSKSLEIMLEPGIEVLD